MPEKYKIAVLIDYATVPDKDPQFRKYPFDSTTEYDVIQAIRELGYEMTIIPVENSLKALAGQLKRQKSDLVFNLTEEFKGDRQKDILITSLLSRLKIPFTGTSSAGLALCRNKILSKQVLAKNNINVPKFLCFPKNPAKTLAGLNTENIRFPLVVKPALEDGSDGISSASIVNNINALKKRVRFTAKKWKQPVIAEEFIDGREFYVGVIGNKKPETLSLREYIVGRKAGGPRLATYRVKWDEKYRDKWKITFDFAKLDKETTEKISKVCKKVYRLLNIRDYGRIDLRLTQDGKIVILEANANPDIGEYGDLAEAARRAGISYKKLVKRIISEAMGRKN